VAFLLCVIMVYRYESIYQTMMDSRQSIKTGL
jgi:hypothetical protein